MPDSLFVGQFQFPVALEIFATVAWAISGAIVARARGFDFTGVFVIALVSCIGGGLIRDGIFLQAIPALLRQPQFLLLALLGAGLISVFGSYWQRLHWWDNLVQMIDAVGTPAYTLIGFQLAYLAGISLLGALFVGLVNGVAGGVLRDVLVGDVPRFFRPGQRSAVILVVALSLFVGLLALNVSGDAAAWIAIGVSAIGRWLVIRFNLQTSPVSEWKIGQNLSRLPAKVNSEGRAARGGPASSDPGKRHNGNGKEGSHENQPH